MKKLLILSVIIAGCLVAFSFNASAQIPQGFTYQALVKNQTGIIANTDLNVKIGILSDPATNTYVWEEQHSTKTNADGLLTVIVGDGTRLQGPASFSEISWTDGPLYLRVEVFYQGSWKMMGTTRMWSTPYSMVSGKTDGLNPGATLVVESADDSSQDPLFEVKRKDGQTVFSVYPDAVNVFVPNTVKGTKGGFAIGGFGEAKGVSQDYFRVTPDSIRAYINNNPAKGVKGGFAIGGFDEAKGILPNYFMNVNGGTALETVEGSPQILWYPNKNAFLAGNVFIESADSVGSYSTALGYRSIAIGDYSQAFGYRAIARGDYSTSIGKSSIAGARAGGVSTASNAFAFGNAAKATGPDSYALGAGAVASGYRSFAFGSVGLDDAGNATSTPTTASQSYTVAIGMGAQATQKGAMALGIGALASGSYSNSFGFYSTSSGVYSTALGYKSVASNYYAGALGYYANAGGQGSLALGYGSSASSNYASAVGSSALASNTYASAFGRQASAGGPNSVAIGYLASTGPTATDASAFGKSASATGVSSMALGVSAIASGSTSVSIGYSSDATNSYSMALGYNAQSSGQYALGMGYNPNASGNYATAIGYNSVSSGTNSFSFGSSAQATNTNALALGNGTIASGTNSTAMGYQSQAQGDKSIAIGSYYSYSYLIPIISLPKGDTEGTKGLDDFLLVRPITSISTLSKSFARANIASGQYSVAIGNGNLAQDGGLVFGSNSDAIKFGALALGTSASANEANSVAMGYNSVANGIYSMALGNNVTANSYGEIALGQWNEVVTGTANTWNDSELLFTLGNGVNTDNRSNAMTIYKNGKTIIRGRYAVSTFNYQRLRLVTFPTISFKDYVYGIYTNLNRDNTSIEYYYSGYFGATGTAGTYYGLYADLRSGASIDVAEYIYDSDNNTEPADVVVADPSNKESVVKSSKPYQTGVVGVISTKPHMTMGMELVVDEKTGEPLQNAKPATRLALTGRVPVKVTGENGPIVPGDLLTTSSTTGHAMKWTLLDVNSAADFADLKRILAENERRRNAIIGKAVESFAGSGTGKVVVLIALQ